MNEYIRTVLYTLMNERRCKVGKWRRRKKETNEAHKRKKYKLKKDEIRNIDYSE